MILHIIIVEYLNVTLSCFSIFSREIFGEAHVLSEINNADQTGDILKHPLTESFLHLKWLLIRKVSFLNLINYFMLRNNINCQINFYHSNLTIFSFSVLFRIHFFLRRLFDIHNMPGSGETFSSVCLVSKNLQWSFNSNILADRIGGHIIFDTKTRLPYNIFLEIIYKVCFICISKCWIRLMSIIIHCTNLEWLRKNLYWIFFLGR